MGASSVLAPGLPGEMTSFVGRRREVAEIRALLSSSNLVTVTGTGGVGKTRLALQVARRVQRSCPDGVFLVELDRLSEPSLLPCAVADSLGLRDHSRRDPESVLADYLSDKQLLMVLDNCEHLLPEAHALVECLLSAAPALRILATSRERLGIRGEQVYLLSPMSLPAPESSDPEPRDANVPSEALALFEQRASSVVPGFTLGRDNSRAVTRICQRLDGLPLAIELAAVWVRTLSVQQILERLDDRFRLLAARRSGGPARHQTLWAAVDWSYALASQQQQTLWRRLSVFAGGFDRDAAEEVCADPERMASQDVCPELHRLVEQGVLRCEDTGARTRYRMLETVREYGRRKLREAGEELPFLRRHRDYYLAMAEDTEARWFGPHQAESLQRLRSEDSNLQAALEFCWSTVDEASLGTRMAVALWFYWIASGFLQDGRYWMHRAVDTRDAKVDRVAVLTTAGYIAARQGDVEHALPVLEQACDLAQRGGDDHATARAMQTLAFAKLFRGDRTEGKLLLEQALSHYQHSDRLSGHRAQALFRLATTALAMGDINGATAGLSECRELCQAAGDRWCLSWVLAVQAQIDWVHGSLTSAEERARQSLRHARDLGDLSAMALAIEVLAWSAIGRSDAHRAARLMGISSRLWKSLGRHLFGFWMLLDWHQGCETRCRELIGDAAVEDGISDGRQADLDSAIAYALGKQAEPRTTRSSPLTPREREIAELVAQDLTNRDIANKLVIAQRTVDSHLQRILAKLGFTSRSQIVDWINERTAFHA